MKSESDSTPTPAPTPAAAPTTTTTNTTAATTTAPSVPATPVPTTYTPTQWATTTQIPIDPALQQQSAQHTTTTPYQHYQAYASHYSQNYAHYQPYAASLTPHIQVAQSTTPAPQRAVVATPATTSTANTATAAAADSNDLANLNDALGSAGVDLRAEEETLQRTHEQQNSYRSFEDRTRKQPNKPAFDTRFLGTTMRTIGTSHKVNRIPDDSVNYLALALRARLQDLVTSMITAAHHRTDTQFDKPASHYDDGSPMWSIVVRSDVAKQLAALEKVEREEELRIRRERKERLDMAAAHAAALAAQANGTASALAADGMEEGEGGAKKKRKKEGPGVTARNMSEDVRKKMSNAVATQAAGLGGKYAWMTAANNVSAAKPKAGAAGAAGGATTPATTTTPAGSAASSWARPYVPTKKAKTPPQTPVEEEDTRTVITMRDAMFVIEKERGHGGGRGAARGWV